MATPIEVRQVNIRVPIDILNKIARIAKDTNKSNQDIYNEAISEYVTKYYQKVCQGCNSTNSPDAKFCSNCGLPLNPDGLEELRKAREYLNKNPHLLLENYERITATKDSE